MKNAEKCQERETDVRPARLESFLKQATLVFAGACSGVVLHEALFPKFYYMAWIGYLPILWGLVASAYLCQTTVLLIMARLGRGTSPCSRRSGPGFLLGLLVLVTLLVGFKVPLYASFLLAKPGLEEALADHHDDLAQVGRVSHNYGIYRFRKADRRCHKKDRVFFQFLDDAESAIIYSETGIDVLCYNSGSKGHLLGNWYWMKED